ncbi:hypothetical protein J1614_004934 [Plenodomus biglobosus]|nr:hypothetical protein J1614_004934 [Plenodomus biglobosus]
MAVTTCPSLVPVCHSKLRAASYKIAQSIPSPAPAYTSTAPCEEPYLSPELSNYDSKYRNRRQNTYSNIPAANERASTLPRSKSHLPQETKESTSPDYRGRNHPHYASHAMPGYPADQPQGLRLPRKVILIPWILASVFFLATLWNTSILFGARFSSALFLHPASSIMPDINVIINGELLHEAASTTLMTPSMDTAAPNTIGSVSTKLPLSSQHIALSIPTAPACIFRATFR